MSKLRCDCGHIIVDQTDYLPYKAFFMRDEDSVELEQMNEDICSFMEAYKENRKAEWIISYFGNNAEVDMPNSWALQFIQGKYETPFQDIMYQCERCGRLLIPTQNNYYASFKPEEELGKGILKGKSNK